MKGTITRCLHELVVERSGQEKWAAILKDAEIPEEGHISLVLPTSNVDDAVALRLLDSTARVLNVTPAQAADAFGEYWCCTYVPRMYKTVLQRFKNAREMILGVDQVHVLETQMIPNAHPPRFEYRWIDDRTLDVTYKSSRNLVEVYAGIVRGVGQYFKEPLVVTVTGKNLVRIQFT